MNTLARFVSQTSTSSRSFVCCVVFALFVCAIDVSVSVSQEPVEVAPTIDREEVLRGIENLRSRSFRVRQDAEESLWQMGPSIEPMLVEAFDTPDLEVRDRITSLRFKFELGLTPDMPESKRRWIMTAIGGSGDKERREATARLAGAGEYSAVMVVLGRINSARELSDYFSAIMGATRSREPSDERDEFHFKLLRIAIAQPNLQDMSRMARHVLRDTAVRKRATNESWMRRLITLIAECRTDATRRSLIDGIYFDSQAINTITESKLLSQWINVVAKDPERSSRLRHVAKVLNNSTLISAFGRPNTSIDIAKLFDNLSPEGRNALVDASSNVPQALSALHLQLGDEALMSAISASAEAAIRGNLLGRLASLKSWPQEKDKSRGVLELIDNKPDGVAKHQLVIGYLEGLGKREKGGDTAPKEVADSLWLMMNTENEEPWQLAALLETYMSPRTFGERQSVETIDRMIRLTPQASPATAQLYAYGPLSRSHLGKELAKHKRSLDFIRSIGNLPASSSINSRYRSLLNSSNFTNSLSTKQERIELLRICRDQIDITPRYYAASGILSNKKLLGQLLNEGQYETIHDCLINSQDPARLASIVSSFLVNEATVKHLVKENRIHEVLDFQKRRKFSENEQFSILYRLVSSDTVVSSLLDAGHYDALLDLVSNVKGESQRGQLQAQLTHRKAYAQLLAKQGKLRERLQELFADKTWVSRRGYHNLIANLDLEDVKGEPEIASIFWGFASRLEREYDRRECIRALLSSKWFLIQLHQQGRLGEISRAIPKLVEPKYFNSTLQSTFRSPNIVFFFEQGQLSPLVELASSLKIDEQHKLFTSLGYSRDVRNWFAGKDQPQTFFRAVSSIENVKLRYRFVAAIFTSGLLRQKTDKQSEEVLMEFVKSLPETGQVEVAMTMLSRYETSKLVSESSLAGVVVKQLDRDDLEPHLLKQFAVSNFAAQLVKDHKKLRRVIELVHKIESSSDRSTAKKSFLRNWHYLSALTDDEVRTIFLDWAAEPNKTSLETAISSRTPLISRLVSVGQFDKIANMIDSKSASASVVESLRWSFYTSAEVVKKLKEKNGKADVLVDLLKQTRGNYMTGRFSQLMGSPATYEWLLSTVGWEPVSDFVQRADQNSRTQILKMMVNRSFVAQVEKHGHLPQMIELVGDKDATLRKSLLDITKEH